MSTLLDDSFCSFVCVSINPDTGAKAYQCSVCSATVFIPDPNQEPPKFPCKKPLTRSEDVGFGQKILNFAGAVASHIGSGMPKCTEEQIIKRHDICRQCEFFKDDTCGKCGCPLTRNQQFVSKLAWADQECPVGKWGKEVTSS